MSESSRPAECPRGHHDTVRLLDVASVGGVKNATGSAAMPSAPSGGGCCGGGCCS